MATRCTSSALACSLLLLLGTAALAAAQQPSTSCPSLFAAPAAPMQLSALVQDCSGGGGCELCQCSLVRVLTPKLVAGGKILASEAYMASSITTLADTLAACKRDFAVQLLENTQLTLAQLSGLETCTTDAKAISQCSQQQPAGSSSLPSAAAAAPAPAASMFDEVLTEACAASVAAAAGSNSSECPSPAAARMAAGMMPAAPSATAALVASGSGDSVLAITASNTRGATQWKAGCWCDETYDPVCDPATRKQYPNACSAKCQLVAAPMPCDALEPLVNQTLAGGVAVYVIDESLMRPAAFDGPGTPAEAPNSQTFYYYYEDDADDTQEALEIASSLAEALIAASYGTKEAAAADAVATALPPALKLGAAANGTVTKADGPEAVADAAAPRLAGMLSSLRNVTLTRQRLQRARAQDRPQRAAAAERANVTVMPVTAEPGRQPASPSWLLTNAPGQAAGVYTRDAVRTSRILASLMAAAQEQRNTTWAAKLVINLAPGISNMVQAAAGAAQARRQQPFAGGLFGGSSGDGLLPQVVATARSALTPNASTNATVAAGNGTLDADIFSSDNSTAAPAGVGAMQGIEQVVAELSSLRQGALANPVVQSLQGAANRVRSALNATAALNGTAALNSTAPLNGTANSTTANGTAAAPSQAKKPAPKRRRFRLFF